jgi:hypothetical protein
MHKEDQEGFKSMLVYYDKKMDEDVEAIEESVNDKEWLTVLKFLCSFFIFLFPV